MTTTEKRDPDLETSPAELRRRADAFEARAKAWRSRPDLTREDRFIARGLELTVAALRASEDYLSLSRETVDHVRTAALAANAADVVRNTQDLQPQQHDRHVVRITAAATGAGRDRHGRAFQVAGAEPNGARLYDACRVLELQTGIERQSIRNMVESSGRTVNDGDSAQLANVEPSLSVSRGMRR
ncbi:MAG: hypothetical protein ACLPYS_10490 [Vulcanimicrobiaceae bacterium]